VQKLHFEMRKVCKDTLAANKNERLEGVAVTLDVQSTATGVVIRM